MKSRAVFLAFAALILTGCAPKRVLKEATLENGFVQVDIDAQSLNGNLVSAPAEQTLCVYLPPSYRESKTAYPVVYYLHGFDGSAKEIMRFPDAIKRAMDAMGTNQFIIVGVNGTTSLGGSFFVNSPVTGNWENYLIKDVIPAVDGHFRTLKAAASRGVAGFSMGGFSAINLGFKHPDVFSAVYALSPGLFDEDGLEDAMGMWWRQFLVAYGAAFSHNMKLDPPYAEIPKLDGTEADKRIVDNWNGGFGKVKGKIDEYLKHGKALQALRIDYGIHDTYPWVIKGCLYFSKSLRDAHIAHELVEHPGGHEVTDSLVEKNMLAFFSRNLKR